MRAVRLPLAVKIPLVVIVFMGAVAVFVTERVLTRLEETQTRHLEDLATVHLDGLASAIMDPLVREDVWEVYDILDRTRQTHAVLSMVTTVVATADGRVLASSDPRAFPSLSPLPKSFLADSAPVLAVAIPEGGTTAVARRDVSSGGRVIGSIHATFDIARLLAERRSVLYTLLGTNAALTLVLAIIAWLTVRRMMGPVRVLANHLEAGVERPVKPIPAESFAKANGEFRRLFGAFNSMVEAVREREVLSRKLADEERLASLGRLASGMAHEINNPLGGLFNAIDTLKQHGQVADIRDRTIALIDRGLKGIRDVVRTALVTYRADRETRDLKPADIDDLQLLINPEIRRKELKLSWANNVTNDIPINASVVRQILLNLLLNACHATPPGGIISLTADAERGTATVVIADTGNGLPDAAAAILTGGQDATTTPSVGLGLWMVRRLVKEVGGNIQVTSEPLTGTCVRVELPLQAAEVLAHVA